MPGSGGIVIGPGGGIFSNPCLFTTCLPTVYGVQRFGGASQQGIQIRVKPRSNYTIAFKTNDGGWWPCPGRPRPQREAMRLLSP